MPFDANPLARSRSGLFGPMVSSRSLGPDPCTKTTAGTRPPEDGISKLPGSGHPGAPVVISSSGELPLGGVAEAAGAEATGDGARAGEATDEEAGTGNALAEAIAGEEGAGAEATEDVLADDAAGASSAAEKIRPDNSPLPAHASRTDIGACSKSQRYSRMVYTSRGRLLGAPHC